MRPAFSSEPETGLTNTANAAAFDRALQGVECECGRKHAVIIDGAEVPGAAWFSSRCPAAPAVTVGDAVDADATEAVNALEAAERAFRAWCRLPAGARYLLDAAARIRRRRFELAAWMVYEVGKSWAEADGEVAERVDLLEYYALLILEFDRPQTDRLARLPNENVGVLMGMHLFGGFNLSGTDSKAGGPDYLLHFLQGKSVGDRLS